MNLEDKKTKVVFLVVSTILVVAFSYYSFAKNDGNEEKKGRTRTLKRDKGESNLEKSRRASRTYERDVKDYSFNDYISEQKEGEAPTGRGQANKEGDGEEKEKETASGHNRTPRPEYGDNGAAPAKKTTKSAVPAQQPRTEVAQPEPEVKAVQESPKQQVRRTGFSGGGAKTAQTDQTQKMAIDTENIKAVILQTKKVKSGDNILLRTTEQCTIEGRSVPENTLVSGTVSLSGSRLNIKVNAIAVGEESIACKLNAYDLDGNLGLKMNKDISYEAKSESVGSLVGEVASSVNVPYIGRIATDVGEKVVSDPTVTLDKGQKMFLRTSN
jgi:hypothetical protein